MMFWERNQQTDAIHLSIEVICIVLYFSNISGQNVPNIQQILQFHVAACGPNRLCDRTIDIPMPENYTGIDPKYCSPCPPCYCDELCESLFDCCPDIQLNLTQRQINKTDYTKINFVCTDKATPEWNNYTALQTPKNSYTYPMVFECPVDFTDIDVKTRCEHPLANDSISTLPVNSIETGLSYRNIHCFICHGATKPIAWSMRLRRCTGNHLKHGTFSTVRDVLESATGSCQIWFEPFIDLYYPYSPPRVCPMEHLKSACQTENTDPSVSWACAHLDYRVDTMYKNMFCYNCKDRSKSNINTCDISLEDYDASFETSCTAGNTTMRASPWSNYKNLHCFLCNTPNNDGNYCHSYKHRPLGSIDMLFDMSSLLGSIHIGHKDNKKCDGKDQFYDYQGKCRPIFCPLGYYSKEDICLSMRKDFVGTYAYTLFFRLRFVDRMPPGNGCELLDAIQPAVIMTLKQKISKVPNKVTVRFVIHTFNASKPLMGNESEIFTNSIMNIDGGDQLELSSKDILISMELIIYRVGNRTAFEDIFMRAREFRYIVPYGRNMSYTLQAYIDDRSFNIFNSKSDNTSECMVHTSQPKKDIHYLTVSRLLVCRQIELEADEYQRFNDYSIYVPVLLHTLSMSQYTLVGERVRVCLDDYVSDTSWVFKTPSHITLYLTRTSIVCSNISLFFLFITMLTYCIFPKYRTLPGKLIMCLVLALFFAVLFWEISYYNNAKPRVCVAMGILIHYFWLCFFVSMHSCCLQMYRVFLGCRTPGGNPRVNRRLLKQYTIFNISAPAIVVTITTIVNVLLFGSSNYTSNGTTCFIVEPISRAVAFILPVSLLVVMNTVLFISTLRRVYSTPRLPNDAGYQHHVSSFAKLFTLTGLTWLLQLVNASLEYAEAGYSVLSIIITVLNSSHGFFIFLAFICNSRVYNSYKVLIESFKRASLIEPGNRGATPKSSPETRF